MADGLPLPEAAAVPLVGFALHPAALGATDSRGPAYLPAAGSRMPSGPPLAPPWSSPFRYGATLPSQFGAHVPNAAAGFAASWLDWTPGPAGADADPGEQPDVLGPATVAPVSVVVAPPTADVPAWFGENLPDPPEVSLPEELPPPARAYAADDYVRPESPRRVVPTPASPAPDPAPQDRAEVWDAPRRRPGFVPAPVIPDRGRRRWLPVAAAVLLIPLLGAGLMLGTRLLGPARPTGTAAVFTAPIMVLRAAAAGRVETVAVANGQPVDPGTVLLTIHAEPPPDPAVNALRTRLAAANDRAATLDAATGAAAPVNDAGRAKLADTQRLRTSAAAEIKELQAALTAVTPRPAIDTAVKAGLNGKVWSIEATSGTDTAAGAPLVRLVDCDHAFLALASNGPLQAGQSVTVNMAGYRPLPGAVRLASGIAEPTGSLVVQPAPLPGPNTCPVGLSATVMPAAAG